MSHTIITRIAFGAAALAGVAALGACGTTSGSAAPAKNNQAGTNAMYADTAHTNSSAGSNESNGTGHVDTPAGQVRRCDTSDLKLEVGVPVKDPEYANQYNLDLTYRNISGSTCSLYGVPGVDLHGPDSSYGDTYSLPRIDNGPAYNEVPAGSSSTAALTFSAAGPGNPGAWLPTTIVTTPPGAYTQLTAAWPSDLMVLRQDGATHPGTWINGLLGTTD